MMEVSQIPIPAEATIKVSKEGKSVTFETKVLQVTDNKYIYVKPIKRKDKYVNFKGTGLFKEIKVQIAPLQVYTWKNIAINKFVEDGKLYLKIKTTTPGVQLVSKAEKAEMAIEVK